MSKFFSTSFNASKALANVVSHLVRKFPSFVFIFIVFLLNIALWMSKSNQTALIAYSLGIAFFSVIIFGKTGNFGESALSLILGLLAVFTIEWNNSNSALFALILFPTLFVYFMIDSIKLASKNETILTQAAILIDPNRSKAIGKELQEIAEPPTKYQQINVIERSEIVRFLVFQRFDLEAIRQYLEYIEVLKVVYQLDLDTANRLFIAIYHIIKNTEKRDVFDIDLDKIVHFVSNTPIPPHDYANVLIEGRTMFIKKGFTISEINNHLKKHVDLGYRIEDFTKELNNNYGV